jgi:hypothetical protein
MVRGSDGANDRYLANDDTDDDTSLTDQEEEKMMIVNHRDLV